MAQKKKRELDSNENLLELYRKRGQAITGGFFFGGGDSKAALSRLLKDDQEEAERKKKRRGFLSGLSDKINAAIRSSLPKKK